MSMSSVQDIRHSIIAALPTDTSLHDRLPEARHVYVPLSHIKALRLEHDLVIGGRGVGKSFWGAALRDQTIRDMLGVAVPGLPNTIVQSGFGERPDIALYPDSDTFSGLIMQSEDEYYVWRAVVERWAARLVGSNAPDPSESWGQTVCRVKSNPESFARLLERANTYLAEKGTQGLLVFDALDRSSRSWESMDKIVKDLLRVVLSLKPFTRIHAKVFLRDDQFDNRRVSNFPDAAKLISNRVDLTWAPHDLHGLLWQYLVNADTPHGQKLRCLYNRNAGSSLNELANGVCELPEAAKREGPLQRGLFSALAGEFMGRDRRRGFTYTWSVGHLADAKRRTSPRSFLAGIRAAAEDSAARYPEHPFPLHYESIKRGVQMASEIRVNELAEDYPWVTQLLEPLSGLSVPCDIDAIEARWQTALGSTPDLSREGRLPPEHSGDGWGGIRRDLTTLGIFEEMRGDRVNMPDLYRVGFGLGRRGGVKPMAKGTST